MGASHGTTMDNKITLPARLELARRFGAVTRRGPETTRSRSSPSSIAVGGYHPKHALRCLNSDEPATDSMGAPVRHGFTTRRLARRSSCFGEASDRVCSKRLKPLLRILLPPLERHGHLHLEEAIRVKMLAMSCSDHRPTPAAASSSHRREETATGRPKSPSANRVRTICPIWNDPPPGSMEMDHSMTVDDSEALHRTRDADADAYRRGAFDAEGIASPHPWGTIGFAYRLVVEITTRRRHRQSNRLAEQGGCQTAASRRET